MPMDTDWLGLSQSESVQLRLDRLSESLRQVGHTSIYDAALEAAQVASESDRKAKERRELRQFVDSGGVSELYNLSYNVRHINHFPADEQLQHACMITDVALKVFQKECQSLCQYDALWKPLSILTPEFVSFTEIYKTMRRCAPSLLLLIEAFTMNNSSKTLESPDAQIRGNIHVVISITILLARAQFSTVQTFFMYYLYASRVPKRVSTMGTSLDSDQGNLRSSYAPKHNNQRSTQPGGELFEPPKA